MIDRSKPVAEVSLRGDIRILLASLLTSLSRQEAVMLALFACELDVVSALLGGSSPSCEPGQNTAENGRSGTTE
jgi:hypothetical protein